MKSFAKLDYHKALGNYYHKTKGYVDPRISNKIEDEIGVINKYEKQNVLLTKREMIVRLCLNLVGQLIGTMIYSVLLIYVFREVFNVPVDYTAKPILLLTIILVGYKVRFRLAEQN